MPGGHEVSEEIEHAVHENKGIALLIAVLALFLAFASAGGKGAQTEAISENVESANLWAFYQAKAIRATTLRTAAEMLETEIAADTNPAAKIGKRTEDQGLETNRCTVRIGTRDTRRSQGTRGTRQVG